MTDRDKLRQTEAQLRVLADSIASHLGGPVGPPPPELSEWRLLIHSGDYQTGEVGKYLPIGLTTQLLRDGSPVAGETIRWEIESGRGHLHVSLPVTNEQGGSQAGLRLDAGGTVRVRASHARSGLSVAFLAQAAGAAPPPPPVDQPDGGGEAPTPGLSWVAAPRRMPFRVMEERSAPGSPPVTVRIQPKGYEARLLTPGPGGVFDANVPCDVDVEVTALFPSEAWGTQSTLKLKGLPTENLSHVLPGRSAEWEPAYAWGHERTSFGSSDGPVTPANWRTYTIPAAVMTGSFRIRGNAGVRGIVVWILDHGQPRG